jgi:hypothetical protein
VLQSGPALGVVGGSTFATRLGASCSRRLRRQHEWSEESRSESRPLGSDAYQKVSRKSPVGRGSRLAWTRLGRARATAHLCGMETTAPPQAADRSSAVMCLVQQHHVLARVDGKGLEEDTPGSDPDAARDEEHARRFTGDRQAGHVAGSVTSSTIGP